MSKFIMLIAPLAVALTTAPALAHGHHGGGACRQDLQKLCPNVTPGPGSFRDCLQTLCQATPGPGAFASCLQSAAAAAQQPLSQTCQDHLTQMQAKIAAFQEACGSDVAKCGGVSGPHAAFRCLHQQQDLSESCQQFLAARHGHHHHHAPDWAPGSEQGNL